MKTTTTTLPPRLIITSSLLYTLQVLIAGILCGTVRVPLLEPLLGERTAQLLEMPIMGMVILRSARAIVKRAVAEMKVGATRLKPGVVSIGKGDWLIIGVLSLFWLLVVEIGVYAWIHRGEGMGWQGWIWDRDPVAGLVFFGMLGVFALFPAVIE